MPKARSIINVQKLPRKEFIELNAKVHTPFPSNVCGDGSRKEITPKVDTHELFGAFIEKFEEIKMGDYVRIIGKDIYKGHIGLVEGIYMSVKNYIVYKIQLQTNGETVDRERHNLKKYF